MPKINIYLPDELADAVKSAGVPVSAVCQNALGQAVQHVNQVREALAEGVHSSSTFSSLTQFTERSRQVLTLSTEQAKRTESGHVTPELLLMAILEEGSNLAVRVLEAADVDTEQLLAELPAQPVAAPKTEQLPNAPITFGTTAGTILQKSIAEAISFGHNYVGCEHLLLAIVDAEETHASQQIQAQGSDYRTLRRAVKAAVSGYAHLRAQKAQTEPTSPLGDLRQVIEGAINERLEPLTNRLTALEDALTPQATADRPPE